jgi:hypothetical protein
VAQRCDRRRNVAQRAAQLGDLGQHRRAQRGVLLAGQSLLELGRACAGVAGADGRGRSAARRSGQRAKSFRHVGTGEGVLPQLREALEQRAHVFGRTSARVQRARVGVEKLGQLLWIAVFLEQRDQTRPGLRVQRVHLQRHAQQTDRALRVVACG